MSDISRPSRVWFREPVMWLVVGIPLLTVVAGLSTVVIAARHSDPVVADEFRKDGLAIQHDPARDVAAARVDARAQINISASQMTVAIRLGTGAPPGALVAVLSHATRAELDRLVVLNEAGDGFYKASFEPLEAGHWYVELSPQDRRWRLRGDFSSLPIQLELRPGSSR
jgi:uncharacterized protein